MDRNNQSFDHQMDRIYDGSRAEYQKDYNSKTSLSQLPQLPQLPPLPSYDQNKHSEITELSEDLQNQGFTNPLGLHGNDSYIEFHLNLPNSSEILKQVHLTSEHDLLQGLENADVLELPQDPVKEEKVEKPPDDFFLMNDEEWKTMEKVTNDNIYDEAGRLEFAQSKAFDSYMKTVLGYTRIDTEEQLNKYALLDRKTDFLFERSRPDGPGQNELKTDLTVDQTELKIVLNIDPQIQSLISDPEQIDVFENYDESLDSDLKLSGTKAMLSESQKFAYVGLVKLLTVEMATDLALLNQKTTSAVAKDLGQSQKNFANWTMYIMSKLFDHLAVNKEEITMIDHLSSHGVEVSDLAKSLTLQDTHNEELSRLYEGFDLRWVLICDLFLLLLSDGYYDSRSRTLLMRFSDYLKIESLETRQFERRLVESLEMDTSNKTIENKDDKFADRLFIDKHILKNRRRRYAYIGLATLGGSLAIGLSAGLLAPVIGAGLAAGLTTVGISGTSGFLAGVGGSVAITTGGVAIGAKVGNKAGARRLGDVETFEMKPLHNNKRSNLIITVSGWMNGDMDDVRLPFSTVDPVMGDMFSLLWEPEMLKSMGQTIGILASEALSTSIQQLLGATILTALMSAIQLPMALSKLSYLLDNPWNVSLDRAWKAGKILADTLISGNMGVRPITLVGFSLGSRVIYSCLIELGRRGGFGLVENVILLGTPVAVKYDQITLARSVVSGNFVNGYTRNDWILGYLFRATGGGLLTVSGISPIENIPGVENFDCTKFVAGHMSYRTAIPLILKALGWEVLSEEFAEIEEPETEQIERQRQLITEFDEARAQVEKEKREAITRQKTWKDWFRPKQKKLVGCV